MRRAWELLGLDAVLTVGNRPTVYFKSVARNNPTAEAEYHRLLWNQGVANLLVVHDANQVRVYSAHAIPTGEPIVGGDDKRLVEALDLITFALKDFALRVETGQYYRDHSASFSTKASVDYTLLQNLSAASRRLSTGTGKLDRPSCHSLLGRLLFLCYLRDRQIIGDRYLRKAGAGKPSTIRALLKDHSPREAIAILYRLFTQVQDDFNGSLFDDDLDGERRKIQPSHVETLQRLLDGEDLGSGQMALNFPAYDFSLIPIETISAIYENFLQAESENGQKSSGSFYTPRNLAEMTVDVATEGWDTLLDKRCLDPACGSGIFLVILFNRMAEEWRAQNPHVQNTTRARHLRELLAQNLWGVDMNATACRITCFSLYLAFLDQLKPRDIWKLKKELSLEDRTVLPALLSTPGSSLPPTNGVRVLPHNFFETTLPIGREFHLVIGNPPWVGRNQPRESVMENWVFSDANPAFGKRGESGQEAQNRLLPQHQSAHAFMWKAPLHLQHGGRVCLILPSKVWLNRTDTFQASWFRRYTVDRVVQLADYRFVLFENAVCPATIVRYLPNPPKGSDTTVTYDVPKVERDEPRQALITIAPEDRKFIPLADLLTAIKKGQSAIIWKQFLWGTPRDAELLARLSQMPTLGDLAGEPGEGARWVKGQGFKPFHEAKYQRNPKAYGEPKRRWWTDDHKFVDARRSEIDLILLEEDALPVGAEPSRLHRSPARAIFQPPLVLINQGCTKFAYVDFPVVFEHTLQSIAGNANDSCLLKFLAGVLNSDLARYFLFHTSANWGVERDKVHLFELLRLPFPLPTKTQEPRRSNAIVEQVTTRIDDIRRRAATNPLRRQDEVESTKREINTLVADYYGLTDWERMLVDDTANVFEPSSTPHSPDSGIPTLRTSTELDRQVYVHTLCATINRWVTRSKLQLNGRTFVSRKYGLGLVTITKSEQLQFYEDVESPEPIEESLGKIRRSLGQGGCHISYLRGFSLFERDRVHVVKPLDLRHWTKTAALNDADELVTAFLGERT